LDASGQDQLGVVKITQVCELGIENLWDIPHFHY